MEDRPPLTLRNALLRRWLVVLAVMGACVLAAGILSLRKPVYAASAAIFLDVARAAPGFDEGVAEGELLQHDFIVAATSRPVLRAACASADVICTPQQVANPESTLARQISASAYRGTSTLLVTARASTPDQAAALANAVALAILDQDRMEIARLFKQTRDALQKQLTDLQASIDQEQQQLQRSPVNSPPAAAHQAALTRLQAQYSTIFGRLQDLTDQENRLASVATLGTPAVPPAFPQGPSRLRYLAAGLVAGLCLGVLAALLVERFNTRIYDAETLGRAAGSPVTVVAPRSRGRRRLDQGPYSLALAGILARAPDTRTVMVSAASRRDHADGVATGLGAVAARAGQRVVVVQADGQARPRRQAAPAPEVAGLTTVSAPANHGTSLATTVTDVRRDHASADSFVLIAVPSPDTSPAAFLLGRMARRAVLVATAGVTRIQDARRSAELLRHSGVEVAAAVLVRGNASGQTR